MNVGYLLAALGAIGSGTGSVLESVGVRRAGAFGGESDALRRVARQPVYWTGVGVDIVAFLCSAVALHHLPLFLVQSVMACSIAVTALISAALGAPLTRRGWLALAGAALGLVLVALSARPGDAHPLPTVWSWLLLGVCPVVVVIGWYGDELAHRWAAPLLAFGAGLGFTAVAVSARSLPAIHSVGGLLREPAAWSIAANGLAASVVFAHALQKGGATTVAAVMFTTNTVVPSAIGLAVLGDSIRSGFLGAGIAGFLLSVGGAVALAHYSAVAAGHRGMPSVPGRGVPAGTETAVPVD